MALNHILLAAGGTGGHVFPAIAIGNALQATGCRVAFQTDKRGARLLAAKAADTDRFSIQTVAAASPFAGSLPRRLFAMLKLAIGTMQAGWQMIRHRPQAVLGFGGYASAPSMLAAYLLRIPAALHEQNGRIGRANQLLAKLCGHLLLTWQDSKPIPEAAQIRLTGLPVDTKFFQIKTLKQKSATANLTLHIQGGSLGAGIFSHVVPDAIALLPNDLKARLTLSQQVRIEDMQSVKERYEAEGISADLAHFFDDIPDRLAAADLIISRSGAASTTEIAAAGRPAIFIPFKAALDDHQTANADAVVACGGALILQEGEADAPKLAATLEQLLSKPERLAKMGKAARTAGQQNATELILAALSDLAQSKSWRDA